MSSAKFCTCTNFKCPLHPTKHDKGCTPCIKKNLKLKEIPNCFFALLKGADSRAGDTFRDFAALVFGDSHCVSCDSTFAPQDSKPTLRDSHCVSQDSNPAPHDSALLSRDSN